MMLPPKSGATASMTYFQKYLPNRPNRRQLQLPRRWRRILGARGQTALHGAAKYGHAAVVEQLISAGATVDAASNAHRGVGRVFGSGSGEVMEGVRTLAGEFVHWQVIFVLCFGNLWDVEWCLVLKDPYVTYL